MDSALCTIPFNSIWCFMFYYCRILTRLEISLVEILNMWCTHLLQYFRDFKVYFFTIILDSQSQGPSHFSSLFLYEVAIVAYLGLEPRSDFVVYWIKLARIGTQCMQTTLLLAIQGLAIFHLSAYFADLPFSYSIVHCILCLRDICSAQIQNYKY